MTDSITITINVPSHILYNCIKLLSKEQKEVKNVNTSTSTTTNTTESTNNDPLYTILNNLHKHCYESGKFSTDYGRLILDRLSSVYIFSNNKYDGYIEFLSNLDKYDYVYQEVIYSYMKKKINNSAYNSYIEDGPEGIYNIVNLLIDAHKKDHEGEEDVSDILKEYNDSKNEPTITTTTETPEVDSSYITMIKNMDIDTFNNILINMGMTEDSKQQAHKIRTDIIEGNALDMQEIYTFTNQFKQNLSDSNINFSNLLSMFSPKKEEPVKEEVKKVDVKSVTKPEIKPAETTGGFDFNSIMNTLGPMLNSMNNGNRGGRRGGGGKNFTRRR